MKIAILLILSIITNITNKCSNDLVLEGTWVNKEDNLSSLKIDKKELYEIYEDEIHEYTYQFNNQSCDSSYLKKNDNLNIFFLSLSDSRCFEVVNLTKETLVLRYTSSGKLLSFFRKE